MCDNEVMSHFILKSNCIRDVQRADILPPILISASSPKSWLLQTLKEILRMGAYKIIEKSAIPDSIILLTRTLTRANPKDDARNLTMHTFRHS
eukprot:scaffold59172_cov50-Prasinocladus_malaysianus.AAC.1